MSQRSERVADVILKTVTQILREDVQNTKIGFITILRVHVTDDLRTARIYYSVLGTEEEKKTTDINLRNSAKFIKRLLNDRISLRYAINLLFERETSIDESFRLHNIFNKLEQDRMEKERKRPSGEPDGGDDDETPEREAGK